MLPGIMVNMQQTSEKNYNLKIILKKLWAKPRDIIRPHLANAVSYFNYYSGRDKSNKLTRLANKYRSDKGTKRVFKWEGDRHLYTDIYSTYFEPLKDKDINFFEIGVSSGNSVKIWYDYFSKAKIFGFDIDDCSRFNNDRVMCFKGDQANRSNLVSTMKKINKYFDIIIDDGGHHMGQQQISFGTLFKYLKPGGLYFIEDLHTSYWPFNGYEVVYGNVKIDTNSDKTNTTLKMIRDYLATKKLSSMFLTPEETAYLNDQIADCKLFDTIVNKQGPDHLAVFVKKQ